MGEGVCVNVAEVVGGRARITAPVHGWVSMRNADGDSLLSRCDGDGDAPPDAAEGDGEMYLNRLEDGPECWVYSVN